MKELYTVEDLVRIVGVTRRTIYNHIKNGKLPYKRVGSQYRFTQGDVDAWLGESNEA